LREGSRELIPETRGSILEGTARRLNCDEFMQISTIGWL